MESNKRNADKDIEIVKKAKRYGFYTDTHEALKCWLERAVSAEQRVAELEETLRRMMKILEPDAKPYRPEAYAYHEAVKALKGVTES